MAILDILFFSAILIILAMTFGDLSKLRGLEFKPLNKTVFFIFVGNLSPTFGFAYKCSKPGSAGGWFSLCSYINYGKVSWKNTLLPLLTENIEISPSIEVVIID